MLIKESTLRNIVREETIKLMYEQTLAAPVAQTAPVAQATKIVVDPAIAPVVTPAPAGSLQINQQTKKLLDEPSAQGLTSKEKLTYITFRNIGKDPATALSFAKNPNAALAAMKTTAKI